MKITGKILALLSVVIIVMLVLGCDRSLSIRNMKQPETDSDLYNNIENLYSFAQNSYDKAHEKLVSIKGKSDSFNEFTEKAKAVRTDINDMRQMYIQKLGDQINYATATGLDVNRVLNSLRFNKKDMEMAEEHYLRIISSDSGVGSPLSVELIESNEKLKALSEELKEINKKLDGE